MRIKDQSGIVRIMNTQGVEFCLAIKLKKTSTKRKEVRRRY